MKIENVLEQLYENPYRKIIGIKLTIHLEDPHAQGFPEPCYDYDKFSAADKDIQALRDLGIIRQE